MKGEKMKFLYSGLAIFAGIGVSVTSLLIYIMLFVLLGRGCEWLLSVLGILPL